jgi:4-amino-4-deoxy-L-arabinose transferase-like glycosyltransferase
MIRSERRQILKISQTLNRCLDGCGQAFWRHGPILAITAMAAVLIFFNLGRDYFWEDEGDTAVLASSILREGVPVAWDGITLTVPDFGQRLTGDFVMVSHPWLQYYLTAAAFALFGKTPFAARLPFAIAGLATIIMIYIIGVRLLRNRLIAISASTLLLLSTQFLLYSRQARNYTLHSLICCLLVLQFFRLNSWKNTALFALLAILLFHTHPIGLAAIVMLGLLTLLYRPFRNIRLWYGRASVIIFVYAVPWLVVSQRGYAENTSLLSNVGLFLPRSLQFLIECASVTPVIGILILCIVVIIAKKHQRSAGRKGGGEHASPALWTPEEKSLSVVCGAIGLAYVVAMALTQSRDVIWIVGVRYASPIIPFSLLIAGMLIVKLSRSSRTIWFFLMLVFGFTKLPRLTPWVFWVEPVALRDTNDVVAVHVPSRLGERIVNTGQFAYVASLLKPSPGVITHISEFLNAHADPGDIVITNYAWEAVYFHTGLPQGMKVRQTFPIYEAARKYQLPSYTFGINGVRWIVWRRAWAPAWGQDCGQILKDLAAAGIPVRLAASIPETLYENRENVHFRRFAGDRYIYPWFDDLPDVLVYRVDWPHTTE